MAMSSTMMLNSLALAVRLSLTCRRHALYHFGLQERSLMFTSIAETASHRVDDLPVGIIRADNYRLQDAELANKSWASLKATLLENFMM